MTKFAYFSTGQFGRTGFTHEFEIHAADCPHLRQSKYSFVSPHDIVTWDGTAEELVDEEVAVFEDQQQDWSHEHFKIFPCAH